ncbi:MAG TPA: hypothetical protein VGQ61_15455, partial [Candidatus Angelobacter sp.]|nr:hypothetical protein [Candidatus Angelobacter sp.]
HGGLATGVSGADHDDIVLFSKLQHSSVFYRALNLPRCQPGAPTRFLCAAGEARGTLLWSDLWLLRRDKLCLPILAIFGNFGDFGNSFDPQCTSRLWASLPALGISEKHITFVTFLLS